MAQFSEAEKLYKRKCNKAHGTYQHLYIQRKVMTEEADIDYDAERDAVIEDQMRETIINMEAFLRGEHGFLSLPPMSRDDAAKFAKRIVEDAVEGVDRRYAELAANSDMRCYYSSPVQEAWTYEKYPPSEAKLEGVGH